MRNVNIAILDSGVNSSHPALNKVAIENVNILNLPNPEVDTIGHGTAVAAIISRYCSDAHIYSIKAFAEDYETDEDDLLYMLEYIEQHLQVDIINISCGLNHIENHNALHDACRRLTNKNVCIVSALDNSGCVSFPAAFEEVIGVYWDAMCSSVNKYTYIENSIINILGFGGTQRLPWTAKGYQNVSGSSFIAPHIVSLIALELKNRPMSHIEILQFLRNNANSIISVPATHNHIQKEALEKIARIKRAICFPLSKEIHAICGNIDLLPFSLIGVYDIPLFGRVGKPLNEFVYGVSVTEGFVQDVTKLDWNSNFDTLILGHTRLINRAFSKDFLEHALLMCTKYYKNIYCLDDLSKYSHYVKKIEENGNFALSFKIEEKDVQISTMGSLFDISNPVIGVFGTSPRQGKFNVQLDLRRKFRAAGYKVGQLGTEPTSWLFGMDIEYPNGYDASATLSAEKAIFYLNSELVKLRDCDVVIVGAQSQTIPYCTGHLGFLTLGQQNILLAANPDAIILCINANDDPKYVLRTIRFFQNYIESKVIALCMFPFYKDFEWNHHGANIEISDNEIIKAQALYFANLTGLPVYINGNKTDMEDLYQLCINQFSEGESDEYENISE